MCDIASVIPTFSTAGFTHLIPALDRSGVTVSDLICSEPVDIGRRALLPSHEISRLTEALIKALQEDSNCEKGLPEWRAVSCLDPLLDRALGGGFPVGYLSEITGESGAGKTQFLLTLMLAVQLPSPRGLGKSAIYVSTEAALSTSRLAQLLKTHPVLQSLSEDIQRPSLSQIHSIQTPDLESQDHILRYQVPVAIERFNVGLVIVDSIAANYRAEMHEELHTPGRVGNNGNAGGIGMAERRTQLVSLGSYLRRLAHDKGIAIVVANQVADRFMPEIVNTHSQTMTNTPNTPLSKEPLTPATAPPVLTTLDHQQRFFTGWGDFSGFDKDAIFSNPTKWKTPALGLVWSNQIAGRVALIREPARFNPQSLIERTPGSESDEWGIVNKRRRFLRVAFATWVAGMSGVDEGVEYEITGAGVRGISKETDESTKNESIDVI